MISLIMFLDVKIISLIMFLDILRISLITHN